jgi:hypothetical protein
MSSDPAPIPASGASASSTRGTLVVVVMKARHLLTASSSRWTKQSPYATVTLFREPAPAIADSPPVEEKKRKRTRTLDLASIVPADRAVALARHERAAEKRALKRAGSPGADKPLPATPEDTASLAGSVASGTSGGSIAADDGERDWHTRSLSTPPDRRGGQHPVWDAELRFPLSSVPSAPASPGSEGTPLAEPRLIALVEVWAQVGLGRKDRVLGSGRLDVGPALEKGMMDGKRAAISERTVLTRSQPGSPSRSAGTRAARSASS